MTSQLLFGALFVLFVFYDSAISYTLHPFFLTCDQPFSGISRSPSAGRILESPPDEHLKKIRQLEVGIS